MDTWLPNGPRDPHEAKLGECAIFLSHAQRAAVTTWWLKHQYGANTPNWDIASTCLIGNKAGLLLVEAKAHLRELDVKGKSLNSKASVRSTDNHVRIGTAIDEANSWLEQYSGHHGWRLNRNGHYQLSNRLAWAWKVAELGVPVALVYLGFLNATDMDNASGNLLVSSAYWDNCLKNHSAGIIPPNAWNSTIYVKQTPLRLAISSLELTFK
jgi:hypothetical protein